MVWERAVWRETRQRSRMRLPGEEKKRLKQFAKERKQWRRRYFKTAARRKDRGYRMLRAALLFLAVFYLAAAGSYRNLFLNLNHENTVELRKAGGNREEGTFLQELFKITFRLKSGEIIFYHEKTGENEIP